MKSDIKSYIEGETVNIPLGDIVIIPGVNVRALNAGIVAEYAEVMTAYGRDKTSEAWGQPLSITTDGILVNGFHTHAAALEAFGSNLHFKCSVQGTGEAEAHLLAATHNGQHGVRFTNIEKREAVTRWLNAYPEYTDGYLAKQTNVSRALVQKISDELATEASLDRPAKRCWLDSDGERHWIETDKIGETQQAQLERTPSKTEQKNAQWEFAKEQSEKKDRELRKLDNEIKRAVKRHKKFGELYKGHDWYDTFGMRYREFQKIHDEAPPFHAIWFSPSTTADMIGEYKVFLQDIYDGSKCKWLKPFLKFHEELMERRGAESWINDEPPKIWLAQKLYEEMPNWGDDDWNTHDHWGQPDVHKAFEKAASAAGIKLNDHLALKEAIESNADWVQEFYSELRQTRVQHRLTRAIETLVELREYLPPMLGLWTDAFEEWQTGKEFKRDITIADHATVGGKSLSHPSLIKSREEAADD